MSVQPQSKIREVLESLGRAPNASMSETDVAALLDLHLLRVQACQHTDELADLTDVRDGARQALATAARLAPDSMVARSHAEQLDKSLPPLERLIARMDPPKGGTVRSGTVPTPPPMPGQTGTVPPPPPMRGQTGTVPSAPPMPGQTGTVPPPPPMRGQTGTVPSAPPMPGQTGTVSTAPSTTPVKKRPSGLRSIEQIKPNTPEGLALAQHKNERDTLLKQPPANPGSAWLLKERAKRPQGVNDAMLMKGAENNIQNNCSLCTVGVLTGRTASQMTEALGVPEDGKDRQFATVWANPTRDPSLEDAASEDFPGQLSGMATHLKDYADKSGGEIEFIDANRLGPDQKPEPLGEKELLGEMAKMPDGTQFAVFIFPDKSGGGANVDDGHWVTAMRINGKTVFEDYQLALNQPVYDRGKPTDKTYADEERPTVDALPLGPVDGKPIYKHGMFFAMKPTDKVINPPKPKVAVPRNDQPQSQRVAETVATLNPLDWKDSATRMDRAQMRTDLTSTHAALLTGATYTPPPAIAFDIGDPLAIGAKYVEKSVWPNSGETRAYSPFSVAELKSPAVKDKVDALKNREQSLSELIYSAYLPGTTRFKPAKDLTEFWDAAEKLWLNAAPTEPPTPSVGGAEFKKALKLRDPLDFEKEFKKAQLPKIKSALGITPDFELRLQDTDMALGMTPVAVCLTDDARSILFNEAYFSTEAGEPDYDKANAVLLHESHHAMSKGFVNEEFFDDHDMSWDFDEIVTEHFTKKVWDSKYPDKADDYFKYTSYFKGQKLDPSGAGWYGHLGPDLIVACGGEGVLAKAYFAADPTSLAALKVPGTKQKIQTVVAKAR